MWKNWQWVVVWGAADWRVAAGRAMHVYLEGSVAIGVAAATRVISGQQQHW